jgi:hypothetical protein
VGSATPIPGGTGNFVTFAEPSIGSGNVAFLATGVGQQGVYRLTPGDPITPPNPIRVADLGTPIPAGSGSFTTLSGASISGFNTAFVGSGVGQQGVYVAQPGDPVVPPPNPIRVADLTTPIPGGVGTFTAFSPPSLSIDGQTVAFVGSGVGQEGLYVAQPTDPILPPNPIRVADLTTPIPGGFGTFVFIPGNPVRIVNQAVVFIGNGASSGRPSVSSPVSRGPISTGLAGARVLEERRGRHHPFRPHRAFPA